MTAPFWKTKSLAEMTDAEWESLCDGCARCCLHKLEDVDTGEVHYTSVVCRLMTPDCRCSAYEARTELVPDCVQLTPARTAEFQWLPTTCAYRRIHEGKDLEWWHPLVSGDPASVHEAGISIRGKALSEEHVHPEEVQEHIITWVEQ